MVYQNDDFLLKHALVSNESFSGPHHHWKLPPAPYSLWHLATVAASKRTRELGLVTFGLVMCGNRSPSLYRVKYIIVALIKTVLLER